MSIRRHLFLCQTAQHNAFCSMKSVITYFCVIFNFSHKIKKFAI